MVKIVQKFQPPRDRRLAVEKGPSFTATKNARLRGPCLQLFLNLVCIFQDILKKSAELKYPHKISTDNFYEISFPKFSKSYFKKTRSLKKDFI